MNSPHLPVAQEVMRERLAVAERHRMLRQARVARRVSRSQTARRTAQLRTAVVPR